MMKSQWLDDILTDNFSGSGKILEAVQKKLKSLPAGEDFPTTTLLNQLDMLEEKFPHFALLFHFFNALREFLNHQTHVNGDQLNRFIEQYQRQWGNARQKAAENFLRQIPVSGKNILLHSNSSAIHHLFLQMASARVFPEVWQTVSSPVNEGVLQADFLQTLGFKVHLFHEDSISHFIHKIDFALFGADLWWNQFFLNKIGTFPLALIFHYFNKPVFVLAEKRKRIPTGYVSSKRFQQMISEKPKPAEEIVPPQTKKKMQVHNFYFETIPAKLVTRFFTEE